MSIASRRLLVIHGIQSSVARNGKPFFASDAKKEGSR